MSEPPDSGTGSLFRHALLLELDRLLQEYPQRWSTATLRAVVASKKPVDVEQLFDLLDNIEEALAPPSSA